MIARGFKPVVWVGAVGAAALGCYMLSLRVASERADLSRLDRRIVATQQQIRSLNAELGTRGRLAQLEQWNDQVLALSAPNSAQFVDRAQLARFEIRDASPLDGAAEVRMASADATAAPAPQAAPAPAAAPPAPQHAVASPRALPAPPPVLQQASVQRTSYAVAPAPVHAPAAPARLPAPTHAAIAPARRPAAVHADAHADAHKGAAHPSAPPVAAAAATPSSRHRTQLVDDRTLRALGETARRERSHAARD